tara:strand:+ start:23491 stop:23853 length:363 start_codon:yes stop_codon:yes gene_type:complete
MITKDKERDFHMEALTWKTSLQETEGLLEDIEKKIHRTNSIVADKTKERFALSIKHYLEKIKNLKQRVSIFENRLSFLNECDTSQCDLAFFEEADDISTLVKICTKNVKVLLSDSSYYST